MNYVGSHFLSLCWNSRRKRKEKHCAETTTCNIWSFIMYCNCICWILYLKWRMGTKVFYCQVSSTVFPNCFALSSNSQLKLRMVLSKVSFQVSTLSDCFSHWCSRKFWRLELQETTEVMLKMTHLKNPLAGRVRIANLERSQRGDLPGLLMLRFHLRLLLRELLHTWGIGLLATWRRKMHPTLFAQ